MTLTTTLTLTILFVAAFTVLYFVYHGVQEIVRTISILFKD